MAELITNGSFYADTTGWGAYRGTTSLASVAGGQIGNCLEINTDINSWCCHARQLIYTVPGARYAMTFWHKNGAGDDGKAYVVVDSSGYLSAASEPLPADGDLVSTGYMDDASWTQRTYYFVASTDISGVHLCNYNKGNAITYYDEVSIQPTETVVDTDSFKRKQLAAVRRPTYSVFSSVIGDISDYVTSIDVATEIEDTLHEPSYGRGSIVVSNKGGQFTDAGIPLFEKNYRIKVWAGFDDDNAPIWSGVVTDAVVDTSARQITLSVAQHGEVLARAMTSGDFADYDSPKLLIDELCRRLGLAAPEYENEDGVPTTYTFGITFVEFPRSYWSLVHGACLCIFYVPYFDANSVLQLKRRSSFTEDEYVFDDTNIDALHYDDDAELINNKVVDYGTSIKFGFRFGDNVNPYQQSYSAGNSYSQAQWGEDADYETDQLIGTYENAKLLVAEILDWYAYRRVKYTLETRGIPQLNLFDRVTLDSDIHNVHDKYRIAGITHSLAPGSYTSRIAIISHGERL